MLGLAFHPSHLSGDYRRTEGSAPLMEELDSALGSGTQPINPRGFDFEGEDDGTLFVKRREEVTVQPSVICFTPLQE